MVDTADRWSARATRGPALTVLALGCLASFAHGLLGRGDLLLSPPQREPAVETRAEVTAPPPLPPVEAVPSPQPAAAEVVVAARDEAPAEPATTEATRGPQGAEEPLLVLAPAEPAAPPDQATAPSAADDAVPAAEVVAPAPDAPPDVGPPLV